MAFANLEDILNLSENLIKYLFNHVLSENHEELKYFEERDNKIIISNLKKIIDLPFERASYTKAIEILSKSREDFIHNNIY